MTERLLNYVRSRYGLMIAERTAMTAIRASRTCRVVEIRGRDAESGLPATVKLSAQEIRNAILSRP